MHTTQTMVWRRTLVLLLLLSVAAHCRAQEWSRFRGPNGSGISEAKTIPSHWGEGDYNWKIPLPGPGHSSPVIWGERVFVTSGDDTSNRIWVICINTADGKMDWKHAFPLTLYRKNGFNTVASGSPAADPERMYAAWTTPERLSVAAFRHDGKRIWERDLGPFASQHGGGLSPVIYKDRVILANQQDGESSILALDSATGATRWKTPRRTTEAAYATPCVLRTVGGKEALIFANHSHGISAVQPETGQVLWEMADVFDKRVVSSPLIAAGLIVGACGSGEGGGYLVAVRTGDEDSDQKPELAYTIRRSAPYVPTSISVGELLFLWEDEGTVTCLEARTGEVRWRERVGKHYFSSPVYVDGRLFCVSTTGEVVVIKASDRFELLARNPLNETTHSTPAVSGGRMYIHTAKHLISIGGSAAPNTKTSR
jgi:outer membrane protein assembly factor BamB